MADTIAEMKRIAEATDEALKLDRWAGTSGYEATFDPPTVLRLLAVVEAAKMAAQQFRFYAAEHRKKGTSEGRGKAHTNADYADRIEAALKSLESPNA